MESIGFKEWSLVCDAMGRGEQSIILRKGGIAEGRSGFSFRYREFFLFPTFFHGQVENVRVDALLKDERSDRETTILFYAKVEQAWRIDSLETVERLAPLHVLKPQVIYERFNYKSQGLNVAFVRVFRLEREWILPNEKRFGGCRSWVGLPEAPQIAIQPVLDDAEQIRRRGQFETALSIPSPRSG